MTVPDGHEDVIDAHWRDAVEQALVGAHLLDAGKVALFKHLPQGWCQFMLDILREVSP